jgi:hypothetical protein
MKSLKFLDISLLSLTEGKARQITFDLGSNLIFGLNHTGKSTLTKMLFETLGASPSGNLDGWDKAVISCVSISVDGVTHKIVRQGDRRALFSGDDQLIGSASRMSKWSEIFNALTNFNLVLSDKQDKTAPADPACFFLPFYINQDGSWGATWGTFRRGLGRFKSPIQPILEYFSQIVPSGYYTAKAAKDNLSARVADLDRERNALARATSRVTKALPVVGPKITAEGFEDDIARLTKEINGLNQKQEGLRVTALQQNEMLGAIQREISAAERALQDFGQDSLYLDGADLGNLSCPTCGAEHSDTFLSTLEYAEDARAVESTVLRLRATEQRLREQITSSAIERATLKSAYDELSTLLETKRGELKFSEIVESLGAGSALSALDAEEKELEKATSGLLDTIHSLTLEMKSFTDKDRKKLIRQRFRDQYIYARNMLNLFAVDVSKQQISNRPDLSGSGGPRAILAYYSALWQICSPTGQDGHQPPSIPLVIDCPNQQGQDAKNLPAIITFIATRLPSSAQAIVTFESDVPDHFNKKLELIDPRGLLREDEFVTVSDMLNPMVDVMQQTLLLQALRD